MQSAEMEAIYCGSLQDTYRFDARRKRNESFECTCMKAKSISIMHMRACIHGACKEHEIGSSMHSTVLGSTSLASIVTVDSDHVLERVAGRQYCV